VDIIEQVRSQNRLSPGPVKSTPLTGGTSSLVFLLEDSTGAKYVLKQNEPHVIEAEADFFLLRGCSSFAKSSLQRTVQNERLLNGNVLIGLYLRLASCVKHHPADWTEYEKAWVYWKDVINQKK
jgi:hypothetical protein